MLTARILGFGTELVLGRTIDTNSAWLAQRLAEIGIRTTAHMVAPDDLDASRAALRWAIDGADVVLCTGGLGPTDDDLTRQALADVMGAPLESHPELLRALEEFFAARRRAMPRSNLVQALVPLGAAAIPNRWGTAPGLRAVVGRAMVFCMPGVPGEMQPMFTEEIRSHQLARTDGWVLRERVVQTFGGAEADIGEKLADLMTRGRDPEVGTVAKDAVIGVRLIATAATPDEADSLLTRDVAEVRLRLGSWVFGENDATLQARVGELLLSRGLTLATAESCTGGLITQRLTQVPGSSRYLMAGYITYSNEAKVRDLSVSPELLARHGAVSAPVAEAMASGCRARAATDYGIAATGIAGPGGGTPEKPVGLVFLALASANGVRSVELRWGSHLDRGAIRDRSAKAALNLLRLELERPDGR